MNFLRADTKEEGSHSFLLSIFRKKKKKNEESTRVLHLVREIVVIWLITKPLVFVLTSFVCPEWGSNFELLLLSKKVDP